jgi:hypothetical protein
MSTEYTYRRKLRASELLPAVAAGVSLGLAGFYLMRLFLERTPVVPRPRASRTPARTRPPQPRAVISRSG